MAETRTQEQDQRIDYVEAYLAPWRCERNRVNRLGKNVSHIRTRVMKHHGSMLSGATSLML